jgi:hypothetical protein
MFKLEKWGVDRIVCRKSLEDAILYLALTYFVPFAVKLDHAGRAFRQKAMKADQSPKGRTGDQLNR